MLKIFKKNLFVMKKLFLLPIFFLSSLVHTSVKKTSITVFVHGSFSLKPHLNIVNIIKMLNDSIEESVYYRSTEINRRDPFFYKNQAMGELGLHYIDIKKQTNLQAAPTVAQAYEKISEFAGYPPSDQYYTFGWSGLVSHKLRYIEAGFLYRELGKLVTELRNKGEDPYLRILGYSHGGNLALQLGAIHQTKKAEEQISVDEFHLIGTPIQIETDYLITSPIFKRVYNWYSRNDGVQTLDCFSFKRFFSKKKFSKRCNFSLPEKLTQIRIKISDFTPKKSCAIDHVPKNEREMKRNFIEHNFDPGHFELWFMGWTTLRYRQTFPVNPLPFMIFIPLITKYIDEDPNTPHDIVAFIKPYFNQIELYPYRTNRKKSFDKNYPFVDALLIDDMKKEARLFMPDNYNIEIYNRKVYDAIKIVDHELSSIKKITLAEQRSERKKDKSKSTKINLHDTKNIYEEHLPSRKKKIIT